MAQKISGFVKMASTVPCLIYNLASVLHTFSMSEDQECRGIERSRPATVTYTVPRNHMSVRKGSMIIARVNVFYQNMKAVAS